MPVKWTVKGVEEIVEYLKALPRGSRIVALREISEYLLGNKSRGLRHYPPRRSHGANNPYQWQSERQRRAFFATDGFGRGIPSKRTEELQSKWQYHEANSDWTRVNITNEAGHAQFVVGDDQQRGHRVDGWRKVGAIVASNIAGAIQAGERAVQEWLRKRGK